MTWPLVLVSIIVIKANLSPFPYIGTQILHHNSTTSVKVSGFPRFGLGFEYSGSYIFCMGATFLSVHRPSTQFQLELDGGDDN